VKDGHPLGQGVGIGEVVGDHQYGDPGFLVQAAEQVADLLPEAGVQGRQGFVQQQNRGGRGQGPRQRNPLFLAAAEGRHRAVEQMGQPQARNEVAAADMPVRIGPVVIAQAVMDVFFHTQVGEQGAVLVDDAHAACSGGSPVTSRSETRMRPPDVETMPITDSRISVLPEPVGPSRQKNSPCSTSRSTGPREKPGRRTRDARSGSCRRLTVQ
jgi:hypothetical protein